MWSKGRPGPGIPGPPPPKGTRYRGVGQACQTRPTTPTPLPPTSPPPAEPIAAANALTGNKLKLKLQGKNAVISLADLERFVQEHEAKKPDPAEILYEASD